MNLIFPKLEKYIQASMFVRRDGQRVFLVRVLLEYPSSGYCLYSILYQMQLLNEYQTGTKSRDDKDKRSHRPLIHQIN